ncbi:MAG: hypothetical protein AAF721_03375 [Myxococcota bacterium]
MPRRTNIILAAAAFIGLTGFASTASASPRCSDKVLRKAAVRNVAKQLRAIDPIPTDGDTRWYAIKGGLDDSKKNLTSAYDTVSRASHRVHTWIAKTRPKHRLDVTLKRGNGGRAFVKLCAYKVPGKWDTRNAKLFDYRQYKSQGGDMITLRKDGAVNMDVPTDPGHRYIYLLYIEPEGNFWQRFAYQMWMAAKAR